MAGVSVPGGRGADLMTLSKVHLSNVDISTVYLNILSVTLHKIKRNKKFLHGACNLGQ